MSKQELYISIDIETDGPAPGHNSMLSLGAAAFLREGVMLDTWYRKIEPLAGAVRNDETMEFWKQNPEAWKEANSEQQSPWLAMELFASWCEEVGKTHKLVAVAWPAAFDFAFVNYYLWRFAERNPLGFACLDIRSYANGMFKVPGYYEKIPEGDLYKIFDVKTDDLRSHVAVDDAVRQGRLLVAMLGTAERWPVSE